MNEYQLRCRTENENMLWFCYTCLTLFRKRHCSAANTYSATIQTEDNVGSSIIKLQEEVHHLKNNMSTIQKLIAESQSTDSADYGRPTTSTPMSNNSRTVRSLATTRSPDTFKLRIGSRAMDASSFSSSNAHKTFWMIFTRVAKHVTIDDISRMVSKCLKLNDSPAVTELIPRWMNSADVLYTSFKVGLDWSLKDEALDESTWPQGLQFREFFPRTLPFWEP